MSWTWKDLFEVIKDIWMEQVKILGLGIVGKTILEHEVQKRLESGDYVPPEEIVKSDIFTYLQVLLATVLVVRSIKVPGIVPSG